MRTNKRQKTIEKYLKALELHDEGKLSWDECCTQMHLAKGCPKIDRNNRTAAFLSATLDMLNIMCNYPDVLAIFKERINKALYQVAFISSDAMVRELRHRGFAVDVKQRVTRWETVFGE